MYFKKKTSDMSVYKTIYFLLDIREINVGKFLLREINGKSFDPILT